MRENSRCAGIENSGDQCLIEICITVQDNGISLLLALDFISDPYNAANQGDDE